MSFPNGVYTAIVTPMLPSGKIDYDSLANLVSYQLKGGVTGLVVFGTTGESPCVSDEEFVTTVRFVNKMAKDKAYNIVGVTGNWTEGVVYKANLIKDYCDAMMITVPYYNKPDQKGIVHHFIKVFSSFPDKPMMLYNVPGRTVVSITPESVKIISDTCPNLQAIKEASEKLDLIVNLNKLDITKKVKVFAGDDGMHIPMHSYGAKGVISVVSNFEPSEVVELWNLLEKGNVERAGDYYCATIDTKVKEAFKFTNPTPSKHFLVEKGIIASDMCRLPLMPLTDEEKKSYNRKI